MGLLLNCQSISKSFSAQNLFEGVSFTISEGDRLGIVGPNGSGKSTLLQILAGAQSPDVGEVTTRKGVRLGYVAQDSIFPEGLSVGQVMERAAAAATLLDEAERHAKVVTTLGIVGFTDENQAAASLSGGWRKRLALAEALVASPDILLLDEPTNHLDLHGILWLEKLLLSAPFAVALVSHDRYFLENLATSMAELNKIYPNGLFLVEGNYSRFLEKRDEYQAAREKLEESLATKVKREVEWLRRGAKARTTKAKARIQEAGRLSEALDEVRAGRQTSSVRIDFTASDRKTKKLLEAKGLAAQIDGRALFDNLAFRLSPGVRVGLVGPNGSGKTTLLRLLTGELDPAQGTIERADNLRIVYFDQERARLDMDATLRRALAPEGDSVIYRGRQTHVAGWAKRFLFRGEQLEMTVGRLSGGERARVAIARLMLEPADILLLDEPTNDLDLATLDVLEESLADFPGAMVLVTHDRYLLDRVSNMVIGLDGMGAAEVFADYRQWEQWTAERRAARIEKETASKTPAPGKTPQPARKRLSYLESREWEGMESAILDAESALERCKGEVNDSAAAADPERLAGAYAAMVDAQAEVDRLYARWAELADKTAE